MEDSKNPADGARQFWEAGYTVFGLHPINEDKTCGCGNPHCKAVLKHPIASNWQHTPHWNEEQFANAEEAGRLDSGYGVLVKGLLVVDVDARNGGVESYARLVKDYPAIAGAGLIVETGSGGGSKHLYFKAPENVAFTQHLDAYKGIDFKSSGYVVGAGSLHASGNRYKILIGSPSDIDDAPQELLDLLKKPERHRSTFQGKATDVSFKDLADMLTHIDPDIDHDTWLRCGMAIHHVTNGTGFDVWDDWSSKGTKYPNRVTLMKRWDSFGSSDRPIKLGTLVRFAEQGGWLQPVTFESMIDYDSSLVDDAVALKPKQNQGVNLIRGDAIVPESIDWLWNGYFARGKMQIIAGAAGTGKTTIAVDFAATVTAGTAWPDGTQATKGNVVIWSGEDGIADTLLPRLIAAGANKERVFFVDVVKDKAGPRPFDPSKDMPALEKTIADVGGADLIIIDPIVSAVGGDSHKNAEVRKGLRPVVDLAMSVNAAIIGITHLSKGSKDSNALERVTGSLAFGAVARVVYITIKKAAPEEQNEEEGSYSLLPKASSVSAFIRCKSNIGPRGGGFEYELSSRTLVDHPTIETSSVIWRRKLTGDPEWLMAEYESKIGPTEKAIDTAKSFLKRLLKNGPMWGKDVLTYGAQQNMSESTLIRAKKEEGIISKKQTNGRWFWSLPEPTAEPLPK